MNWLVEVGTLLAERQQEHLTKAKETRQPRRNEAKPRRDGPAIRRRRGNKRTMRSEAAHYDLNCDIEDYFKWVGFS